MTLPIPINVPTPILQFDPVLSRLNKLKTLLLFSKKMIVEPIPTGLEISVRISYVAAAL